MYRESDRRVFMLLSLISTLAILGSFVSIVLYHFFIPRVFYRDTGFILLIFSGLLKLQMYFHKLLIIERRVSAILQPTQQRQSSFGRSAATLGLLTYAIFFWITLITIIVGYIPVSGWGEYYPF